MVLYLIGSLRNPEIPKIGNYLRSLGIEVFDDWHSAGERADDAFYEYEKQRNRRYKDSLKSFAARHIFNFDLTHLNRCDAACLVLPAGKSGHLELGYVVGKGKRGFILLDGEPERIDQMHQFAEEVFYNKEELGEYLCESTSPAQ